MRLPTYLTLLGALVGAAVGAAVAAAGGPSPGVVQGASGVTAPRGDVRYVTVAGNGQTAVEAVSTRSGRVVRFAWVAGEFGIPMVAFDGTAGGLTRDGKSLVLAPATYGKTPTSRFVVLSTRKLKVRRSITLPGTWSYDALSPDARTLYLIEYVFDGSNTVSYRVRAYDLAAGRLLKQVIADKSERESTMSGSPVTRVANARGSWVYTLYAKPGKPFIHALDAAHRAAVCVDLPWNGRDEDMWKLHLSLSADGARLVVHGRDGGTQAVVDTKSFRVSKA